jgi:hypothetical protein
LGELFQRKRNDTKTNAPRLEPPLPEVIQKKLRKMIGVKPKPNTS